MSSLIGVFTRPLGLALTFAVLHSADFYLTLAGAYWRSKRPPALIDPGGSYELNPLFQRAVDTMQWASPRFLLSVVGISAILYAYAAWVPSLNDAHLLSALEFLAGGLVFSRVVVISRHLHNIWLFRRAALNPDRVQGGIRYDRATAYTAGFLHYGSYAAVLLLVWLSTPRPFYSGGATVLGVLSALLAARGLWRPSLAPTPPAA
jgi:hypothetical protein